MKITKTISATMLAHGIYPPAIDPQPPKVKVDKSRDTTKQKKILPFCIIHHFLPPSSQHSAEMKRKER